LLKGEGVKTAMITYKVVVSMLAVYLAVPGTMLILSLSSPLLLAFFILSFLLFAVVTIINYLQARKA
jgi:hypothetical protein